MERSLQASPPITPPADARLSLPTTGAIALRSYRRAHTEWALNHRRKGVTKKAIWQAACPPPCCSDGRAPPRPRSADRALRPKPKRQQRRDRAEIVVTAQKRAQNLQDVPAAVSAIGGDALEARGINETSDLMGAVPSLQISTPYGKTQPNFSLRGISVANEFSASTASPVRRLCRRSLSELSRQPRRAALRYRPRRGAARPAGHAVRP